MNKPSVADKILPAFLGALCLVWVYPIIMILFNSLKKENFISTNTAFQLPSAESFAGLENFVNAVLSKGFVSAFITRWPKY